MDVVTILKRMNSSVSQSNLVAFHQFVPKLCIFKVGQIFFDQKRMFDSPILTLLRFKQPWWPNHGSHEKIHREDLEEEGYLILTQVSECSYR
jgi:hypothetical protein